MTSVLKVEPGEKSEERELRFELDHQAGLTTAQRFEMMLERAADGGGAPAPWTSQAC